MPNLQKLLFASFRIAAKPKTVFSKIVVVGYEKYSKDLDKDILNTQRLFNSVWKGKRAIYSPRFLTPQTPIKASVEEFASLKDVNDYLKFIEDTKSSMIRMVLSAIGAKIFYEFREELAEALKSIFNTAVKFNEAADQTLESAAKEFELTKKDLAIHQKDESQYKKELEEIQNGYSAIESEVNFSKEKFMERFESLLLECEKFAIDSESNNKEKEKFFENTKKNIANLKTQSEPKDIKLD